MNNTRDKIRLAQFGENFRNIRRAKNFSQKALAFEANIEVSQISRIENGIINPTVTTIYILADALGVSPAAFFENPEETVTSSKRKLKK